MKTVLTMNTFNIMKNYSKYICLFLLLVGMSFNAWGADETLTLTGSWWTDDSYETSTGSKETSAGNAIGLAWTETYQNSTYIQMKKKEGEVHSMTYPSTNMVIKSITVTVPTNTAYLYGSTDCKTWTSITFTSGSAVDVESYQYKYFKVTSTTSYCQISAISVTYTAPTPHTITFNAQGGTCGTSTSGSVVSYTLPAASPSAACISEGWGFYGWATARVASETTTAPTIVGKAGDTYYPASDITLHAVYAKGEYTKVNSITSGEKYLIVSEYNSHNYIMTTDVLLDPEDGYYYLDAALIDETSSNKYHAAAVNAAWLCTFTATSTQYYIQNASGGYIDTYYDNDWFNHTPQDESDKYTITFTDYSCTINNSYGTYPALVLFDNETFGQNGTTYPLMLYKATTTPTYYSNPSCCEKIVELNIGTETNAEFEEFSTFDLPTCSSTAADRQVTITVSPSTGYEFTSSARLGYSGDGTATYVSGPTDNGDGAYNFVYQFAQNDNGSGTFSVTSATLINYTISFDANGGSGSMDDVEKTYNTTYTLPACTFTRPTDKIFDHWAAGSTSGTSYAAGAEYTMGAGNITFYAIWRTASYTEAKFSCAELTLTPKLVTAGTPIFITSAASKTVRSQDSILVVGSGLTPNQELEFPGLPSKFAIKTRLGANLQTDVNGEINAVAYIFYTPDAGDETDGLDKLTGISVSVGGAKPKQVSLVQSIIGRHLPADFVIAAKKDGKWWAMPSNMASTTNPTPKEIGVDDDTNPSTAYVFTSSKYGLAGPTAKNISDGNGQYIRFAMSIDDGTLDPHAAPLFGIATGKTTLGKSGTSQISSDLSAGYWWKLVQTNTSITNPQDAKYTIYCANNTQSLTLEDGGLWGLYATNGTDVDELRLIPRDDDVWFEEARIVEWGQHSLIVEFDNKSSIYAKVKAKIGESETAGFTTISETGTSVAGLPTKYNWTINFGDAIDFSEATPGDMLTLKWYTSGETWYGVSNVTIPKIIATSGAMKTIEDTDTPWSKWEVHVLPGVTLDANAGLFSSGDVTIKDLQIYPGATVKITSGTLDVKNLSLRNGWTRATTKKYDVARLQIKSSAPSANLTHTNAYLDWYIDNDQFYPVAVPFPVTVSNITYLNTKNAVTVGGTTGVIRLRYFDGANRAAGKSGNWKYYGEPGSLAVPAQLLPSMGYAMAAKRPGGKAFSIVRMPMTFTNEWTALGEQGSATVDEVPLRKDTVHVIAYGDEKTAEWNKGWNLIGNPYMAIFHGDDSEVGIYGKLLAVTNIDDPKKDKVRYVTIPNSSFTDYAQVNFKDTVLKPSSSFMIQAKETCRIEFSNSKIDKPTAPARYTATPTEAPEQEAYIRLSHEGGYDQMGLIIGEDYTAAYETNADLAKMLGELNTLKTYMIYDSVEMAYLAINEDLAREWIPVTVRIPEAGEYTYSLTGTSEIENLEGVYLIDYESNTVTNLIEDNYSFVAAGGTIADRFAINAIVGKHNTPTDIDIINAGGDINSKKPVKFIWDDKVFILHNGVIYDSTGKRVREINK